MNSKKNYLTFLFVIVLLQSCTKRVLAPTQSNLFAFSSAISKNTNKILESSPHTFAFDTNTGVFYYKER